jgi:hypothetical protein
VRTSACVCLLSTAVLIKWRLKKATYKLESMCARFVCGPAAHWCLRHSFLPLPLFTCARWEKMHVRLFALEGASQSLSSCQTSYIQVFLLLLFFSFLFFSIVYLLFCSFLWFFLSHLNGELIFFFFCVCVADVLSCVLCAFFVCLVSLIYRVILLFFCSFVCRGTIWHSQQKERGKEQLLFAFTKKDEERIVCRTLTKERCPSTRSATLYHSGSCTTIASCDARLLSLGRSLKASHDVYVCVCVFVRWVRRGLKKKRAEEKRKCPWCRRSVPCSDHGASSPRTVYLTPTF